MFYQLKINVSIKTETRKIKDLVYPEFTPESKVNFCKNVLKEHLTSYYSIHYGAFLDVKTLKVNSIISSSEGYEFLNLHVEAQVYFYKVENKQVVDFKVSKIEPTFLEGMVYNSKVEISKNQLSNLTPIHNPATNHFELGEKEKVKEQDSLRCKVTSISSTSHKDYRYPFYNFKASCKNLGTGKMVLILDRLER